MSSEERLILEESIASFYGRGLTVNDVLVLTKCQSPSKAILEYKTAKRLGGIEIRDKTIYLKGYWDYGYRDLRVICTFSPLLLAIAGYIFLVFGIFLVIGTLDCAINPSAPCSSTSISLRSIHIFVGVSAFVVGLYMFISAANMPNHEDLKQALSGASVEYEAKDLKNMEEILRRIGLSDMSKTMKGDLVRRLCMDFIRNEDRNAHVLELANALRNSIADYSAKRS